VGDRIKYVRIDPHEQARDLRNALDLLAKAQVITKAYHSDASGIPLRASIDQRKFKTYFMDCGLMNSMCGIQWISPDDLKRNGLAFVFETDLNSPPKHELDVEVVPYLSALNQLLYFFLVEYRFQIKGSRTSRKSNFLKSPSFV
jgi:hypothetical protein